MAVKFPVYILAGGKSRRFGEADKARTPVDGTPLLVLVADALAERASSVSVVAARENAYDDLGFRTLGDVIPDRGPAGGILTALRDGGENGENWVMVSGCDWLGLRSSWIDLLAAARVGSEVVVFESDRLEPVFGLYRVSIADRLERNIHEGLLSLQVLLPTFETTVLDAPADWATATNVNTADDLDAKR